MSATSESYVDDVPQQSTRRRAKVFPVGPGCGTVADEIRRLMWDYVGIVRTTKRLERALRRITLLQQEIDEYYHHFRLSNNLLELRNLVQVAELMVRCALQRKESRGLHFIRDYPDLLPEAQPTVLQPGQDINK